MLRKYSLVIGFRVARRTLFVFMATCWRTSPDGQSGFNERRRDDHSLTLWRERFEGIEIKAVEGKGENGHFGQRQFFG